jgi:hypothetical protein
LIIPTLLFWVILGPFIDVLLKLFPKIIEFIQNFYPIYFNVPSIGFNEWICMGAFSGS